LSESKNEIGGTPGSENSINITFTDKSAFAISNVSIKDPKTIIIQFNKSLDAGGLISYNDFIFNPDSLIVQSIKPADNTIEIGFNENLKEGIIYSVTVKNLRDCSGNSISANQAKFALPQSIGTSDIIINEVLFNPKYQGVDFVEIYNTSNKVLDLKELKITNTTDTLITPKAISTTSFLIFPKDYRLLSTNSQTISEQYFVKNFEALTEVASLPSFNNDIGEVILTSNNNIIDDFKYSETMHFPLINDPKGVSLERINPFRPANDNSNWHSAAESAGFATPGYQNSQYHDLGDSNNEISIEPELFSPDNDGYNDVLSINYKFPEPGLMTNVKLFDSNGILITHLVKNELIGTEGTFSWNGINSNNEKCKIGIYVILIETIDIKGTVKSYKKSCVLAGKL
jgi:hypothetical protein